MQHRTICVRMRLSQAYCTGQAPADPLFRLSCLIRYWFDSALTVPTSYCTFTPTASKPPQTPAVNSFPTRARWLEQTTEASVAVRHTSKTCKASKAWEAEHQLTLQSLATVQQWFSNCGMRAPSSGAQIHWIKVHFTDAYFCKNLPKMPTLLSASKLPPGVQTLMGYHSCLPVRCITELERSV